MGWVAFGCRNLVFRFQTHNPCDLKHQSQKNKKPKMKFKRIFKVMHWIQNHDLYRATRVTHDDNHRLWNHCTAETHLHSEAYNNKHHRNNRDLTAPIYHPPLSFQPGKFCKQNISCNGAFVDTRWADKLLGFVRPPDE